MGFSPFTLNQVLQQIKAESWVSLHFDDPEVSGAGASEITGGGYGRVLGSFGAISNLAMYNNEALRWEGLPLSRITHLGGWNAEHKGDLQWSCLMIPARRVLEGKGITIGTEEIALSFAAG